MCDGCARSTSCDPSPVELLPSPERLMRWRRVGWRPHPVMSLCWTLPTCAARPLRAPDLMRPVASGVTADPGVPDTVESSRVAPPPGDVALCRTLPTCATVVRARRRCDPSRVKLLPRRCTFCVWSGVVWRLLPVMSLLPDPAGVCDGCARSTCCNPWPDPNFRGSYHLSTASMPTSLPAGRGLASTCG